MQCGLCSLLSGLLRRAMCIGSRRGSGESYYQELDDAPATDGATIETSDSGPYLKMANSALVTDPLLPSAPVCSPDRRLQIADAERRLLDALTDKLQCSGRFLTMHKRRRKKLTTRSLTQDVAILDDVLHGQVQKMLDQSGRWKFNAFTLEVVTGGRSLPILCVHLFHRYGLLEHFKLDVVHVWKLFSLIEEGYHSTNPYHNSIHATDVTQAMHCFLQQDQIRENITPLEVMASLIGAVAHDLDHPGVNQPFLIATSNHLAALYENTSVLENHHWRSAVGCLLESGIADEMHEYRPELERQISSLILATDITRQQEFISKFRNFLDQNTLNMRRAEDRHFILQISLKCADISNPCRPWEVSKKWSQKVCEEFFRQGDYERQLNLPVTTLCDRHTTSISKIQAGFFKFVVTPLFSEWHRFLNTKLSHEMMHNLHINQRKWDMLIQQELAEETRTEISDAEIIDINIDAEDQYDEDVNGSSENLLPELPNRKLSPLQLTSQAESRRFSVPISITLAPAVVSSGGRRRESLPAEQRSFAFRVAEQLSNEDCHFGSSLSLLSSQSGSDQSENVHGLRTTTTDRPLSAENLLPEPTIASMTSCAHANRLNSVLNSTLSSTKHLIRQQTFPPLQQFVRTRYMSTAADMARCSDALLECGSQSSSSESASPKDHQGEQMEVDNTDNSSQKFTDKMAKLSKLQEGSQKFQKENVDPRKSLARRRGSAPVSSTNNREENGNNVNTTSKTNERTPRRGSVPISVTKLRSFEIDPYIYVDPEWITSKHVGQSELPFSYETDKCQRRSSVPTETIRAETSRKPPEPLVRSSSSTRNSLNGGRAKSRHKILRRQSSGGLEIQTPILSDKRDNVSWHWNKNDILARNKDNGVEPAPTKRRGSLPIEVLTVCYGAGRH